MRMEAHRLASIGKRIFEGMVRGKFPPWNERAADRVSWLDTQSPCGLNLAVEPNARPRT
jgi:hypothetical protein